MNEIGEKLLESLGSPMLVELTGAGLTKKKIIELLIAELTATTRKVFNNGGELIYSDPDPDWATRARARTDIIKLCAFYPPEKFQLQVPSYDNLSDEELMERTDKILDDRKNELSVIAIDYQGPQDEAEKHE